ncbi:MAG: hypothetical protein DLM61_05895 [Pseudonocardiales bacterium]|nr:MAG: hypothetical protein DLM61_05895 [Pseudonocardiales bacterium]
MDEHELVALLRRLAPPEQAAVGEYRAQLARMQRAYRRGREPAVQTCNRWRAAVELLHAAALGSPAFDRYVDEQRARRALWREEHHLTHTTKEEPA